MSKSKKHAANKGAKRTQGTGAQAKGARATSPAKHTRSHGGAHPQHDPRPGAAAPHRSAAASHRGAQHGGHGSRRKAAGREANPGTAPSARSAVAGASASASETDAACALCPIARDCGGCAWLGLPYAEQLARKTRFVADLFDDIAPVDCLTDPIAGMDEPRAFRNKIASPFAPDRAALAKARRTHSGPRAKHPSIPLSSIRCGLFAAGTHRIVEVEQCLVEHPVGRQVIAAVRSLIAKYGVAPYDEDRQQGFLRYVVVRVGHASGEVLVTLVTAADAFPGTRNFCRELVRRVPAVTTVVQNVNTQVTNAIMGRAEHVLYGPGFILDTLCGLSFRISSQSFYQVNAMQTEVLYRTAMDYAGLDAQAAPTIVDAYCGTGTIGLVAASIAPNAQVIGVDKVASAIEDARGNARHNGIGNATFVAEDATPFMRRLAAEGTSVDVVFLDPPRAGSTPEFLQAAAALEPQRIVYISCNPETQARDAEELARYGYRAVRMRAVDMFPHTPHIENVALFARG